MDPAEDEVVREQYGQLTAAEVGQMIDRTEQSVWDRAKLLGLEKREIPAPWSEADLDEVRRCYATERPESLPSGLAGRPRRSRSRPQSSA